MPPVGFEPTFSAGERPQTYVLDHAATGAGVPNVVLIQLSSWGWAHSCSKHVEDSYKHIIEEIVRQVGYLPELYEDARSEKC